MKARAITLLVLLAAASLCSASRELKKSRALVARSFGEKSVQKSARAMAIRRLTEGDGSAVCTVASTEAPEAVGLDCPDGTDMVTDDDGTVHCYGACKTLNTRSFKYALAGDGVSCLPLCKPGEMETARDDTSITCAICPQNYVYLASKGRCYQKCGVGAMAAYPVAIDNPASGGPMCAKACPVAFPTPVSATKCKNGLGMQTTRQTIVRTAKSPASATRQAVERPDNDQVCNYQTLEGDDTCWSCPDNAPVLTQDADGNPACATDTCPDDMNKCGVYCWNSALSDGLGQWDEDSCAAFLDMFSGCITPC